jgi:hypothetical protein
MTVPNTPFDSTISPFGTVISPFWYCQISPRQATPFWRCGKFRLGGQRRFAVTGNSTWAGNGVSPLREISSKRATALCRYQKFRLGGQRRFDSYRKFRLDEQRRFAGTGNSVWTGNVVLTVAGNSVWTSSAVLTVACFLLGKHKTKNRCTGNEGQLQRLDCRKLSKKFKKLSFSGLTRKSICV